MKMTFLMNLLSLGFLLAAVDAANSQVAIPPTVSCASITTTQCAMRVRNAMSDPQASTRQVMQAWAVWVEVYEARYRGMAGAPVRPADIDRFETKVKEKIDSYTSPSDVAIDLAIKRYLPRLAAMLALAEGPVVQGLLVWLSPTPTSTPIQELMFLNDELAMIWSARMASVLKSSWRTEYSAAVAQGMQRRPGSGMP
jgi:hypothetical protein